MSLKDVTDPKKLSTCAILERVYGDLNTFRKDAISREDIVAEQNVADIEADVEELQRRLKCKL